MGEYSHSAQNLHSQTPYGIKNSGGIFSEVVAISNKKGGERRGGSIKRERISLFRINKSKDIDATRPTGKIRQTKRENLKTPMEL